MQRSGSAAISSCRRSCWRSRRCCRARPHRPGCCWCRRSLSTMEQRFRSICSVCCRRRRRCCGVGSAGRRSRLSRMAMPRPLSLAGSEGGFCSTSGGWGVRRGSVTNGLTGLPSPGGDGQDRWRPADAAGLRQAGCGGAGSADAACAVGNTAVGSIASGWSAGETTARGIPRAGSINLHPRRQRTGGC